MRKSELKTGMIVELSNGRKNIVMLNPFKGRDVIIDVITNDFILFNDLREDLTCYGHPEYDIISVKESGKHSKLNPEIILWERKEVPEYTVEELVKKLGHEFKIKK
jgi:hypothetical protein